MKIIVFDAYGTLFNVNSLDGLLTQHFEDKAAAISALWRRKQLEYTWLHTLMGTYVPFSTLTFDALAFSCEHLKVTISPQLKQELRQQYLQLSSFEDVQAVLTELRAAGHELAILSNANPEMLTGAINANELGGLFSAVLSAHQIKMYKPRPQVYQMACDHYNCAPDQVIFVSSNTWDVVGAKQFGFQVAWLNRRLGAMEHLGLKADWEIIALNELIELKLL